MAWKAYFRIEQEAWLDDAEDNYETWVSGKIPMCKKRILVTKWAAGAHRRFCQKKGALKSYWEHAGNQVSVDGTSDQRIKVDSKPDYRAPPVDAPIAEQWLQQIKEQERETGAFMELASDSDGESASSMTFASSSASSMT